MTDKEKAIDFLECRRGYYASLSTDPNPYVKATKVCGYTLAESANACLRAIEALEQQPCEDAISRQAVLSKFKEVCFSRGWVQFRIDFGSCGQRDFLINYIEQLPPVIPHYTDAEIQKMQELEQAEIQKAYELGNESQPKTGYWINAKVGKLFPSNNFKCSECDNLLDFDGVNCGRGNANYCPNCGAKMIEPPESED